MIQYALMCGILSSISRDTAICRISSKPVVFPMCYSAVLSGWNASGMNVTNPCVSSCKLAQLEQVIDAILFGFDMPVEHRAVGVQSELMRRARDVEPLIAGNFVVADDAPHAIARKSRRRRPAWNPYRRRAIVPAFRGC